MVSLEKIFGFQARIETTSKLKAFNNLLLAKPIHCPLEEQNEIEQIYYGILESIIINDKDKFEEFYNRKNKSNPSKESPSPFVNDDFLIFSLIVGIVKYNIEPSWIKKIISLRTRSPLTITLENLVTENYFSKSNLPEIVFIYLQLNKPELINPEFSNTVLKSIFENTNLFESKSDFHIICTLRSYELILELKDSLQGSDVSLLKSFNKQFVSRIKIFAWIIQTIVMISLIYYAFKLITLNTDIKALIDKIGSVLKFLGMFGLSQLGNILPAVKNISLKLSLKLFGYPSTLAQRELNKTKSN